MNNKNTSSNSKEEIYISNELYAAYKKKTQHHNKFLILWLYMFIFSLFLLGTINFLYLHELPFFETSSYLERIYKIIPIEIPIIWLAWFSNKRTIEEIRLREEYFYKCSISCIFERLLELAKDLNTNSNNENINKLFKAAIISYFSNPANAINTKTSDTPIEKILEIVSDKMKN